jgi:Family of unknown function (DUF5995)
MIADVIGEPQTIDDAIAAMRAIDGALADDDGVKWFNVLYLTVTEAIRADAARWEDWAFLERFDVAFARLYFDALLAGDRNPPLAPPAWRPLFAGRHDARLARIQFALAGMNAHINRDLPVALQRMAASEGDYPSRDGARYRDFVRVNDLLERTEAAMRPVLATGLVGHVDVALGDVDNVVAIWKVRKARDAAWTHGEVYWHLRSMPLLQREYLERLDLMVAFAGRGLLVPRLAILDAAVRTAPP